jgi:hypothetical protein
MFLKEVSGRAPACKLRYTHPESSVDTALAKIISIRMSVDE